MNADKLTSVISVELINVHLYSSWSWCCVCSIVQPAVDNCYVLISGSDFSCCSPSPLQTLWCSHCHMWFSLSSVDCSHSSTNSLGQVFFAHTTRKDLCAHESSLRIGIIHHVAFTCHSVMCCVRSFIIECSQKDRCCENITYISCWEWFKKIYLHVNSRKCLLYV